MPLLMGKRRPLLGQTSAPLTTWTCGAGRRARAGAAARGPARADARRRARCAPAAGRPRPSRRGPRAGRSQRPRRLFSARRTSPSGACGARRPAGAALGRPAARRARRARGVELRLLRAHLLDLELERVPGGGSRGAGGAAARPHPSHSSTPLTFDTSMLCLRAARWRAAAARRTPGGLREESHRLSGRRMVPCKVQCL